MDKHIIVHIHNIYGSYHTGWSVLELSQDHNHQLDTWNLVIKSWQARYSLGIVYQ